MLSNDWIMLNNLKIGIVGCGHLGQAIAHSLIDKGLERKNLLISYRANPRTYEMLNTQGLTSCLSTNQEIFQKAGIVLITIRPQDITGLMNFPISEKALVVSCMAGVSTELLYQILGRNVYRMMFSGPDTIVSEKGVATIYPEHEHLEMLLRCMNLTHIKTITEDDLNVFTAGVCMPAAILTSKNPGQQQEAIDKIGKEYPLFSELYLWAIKILPCFQNNIQKEDYVARMITKGGITEAITNSLLEGEPLDIALQKGMKQTQEISKDIQQSLSNHLQTECLVSKQFMEVQKMDKLKNVTIVKKANVYFEGKVTSRTVLFEDGTRKTLGIILPGKYEFNTEEKERMEVLAGKINVLLPGSETWTSYEAGQSFEIPANCRFEITVEDVSDYCCSYLKE